MHMLPDVWLGDQTYFLKIIIRYVIAVWNIKLLVQTE
jgi:hypothetical protein